MTTKDKKQVFALAAALVLLLFAGLALWRSTRPQTSAIDPLPQHTATPDSLRSAAPDLLLSFTSDSTATSVARDSSQAATAQSISAALDSAQRMESRSSSAVSDTLHRYGSQATTMQMLVELLEEKQLLMEEKVELSRRLEIVEVLDSALVHTRAANDSSAASLDSLFSHQLDSLTHKLPLAAPEALPPDSLLPPNQ